MQTNFLPTRKTASRQESTRPNNAGELSTFLNLRVKQPSESTLVELLTPLFGSGTPARMRFAELIDERRGLAEPLQPLLGS